MLAISNSAYIDIIDPIRLTILHTLWGHKNAIKSLIWTEHNEYLISTCSSGGIFFWDGNFKDSTYTNVEEIQPVHQFYDNNCCFNHVYYDKDYNALITLTSYSSLKIMTDWGKTFYYEELFQDRRITYLCFSKHH